MNKYVISVLGGGFCWGFMGFFVRHLAGFGIDSNGAVIVRCGIAAVCFGLLILCRDRGQFRIRLKDLWCFVGTGLFSLLFFTFCYFHAISIMDLSTAAILLYTAPTIVMILSAILFREKITRVKTAAVVLAFAGCCLVSGIGTDTVLTPKGLLFGLGAGFGYALYTIFSRYALQRGYSSSTINFYSCLLAAAGAYLIWRPDGLSGAVTASVPAFLWCLGTGVLSCFVPYMLYTYGLTGLENGRASVLASVEPVVASLVGVFVYHEALTVPSAIGILLVLAAICLLNMKS
ncbi:MAG: EamA family transporter [Lachnospiraceae bacterium]|nr:EamA family transporter [Lachnospiraceae bacterium]